MKTYILFLFLSISSFFGFSQNIEFLEYPIYLDNPLVPRATLLIDLIPEQSEITKPLIIVEGFDPESVTNPEKQYGTTDLNSFQRSLFPEAGNSLTDLIDPTNSNQSYDLIYVNWTNGTDAIQENALVLKNVLAWVNNKKQLSGSTASNVLLGQSMGGIVGKYTLAKMEADGEPHDVRLFVAHDAPMQGANTPLSLQYFSRHAYDQYTSAPILYGLVEVVIPTILNLVELMSLGNLDIAFPSVEDVLTLQDTPAAMQMNYHYVDKSSNPTRAIHTAWQQEFESVGYPTQSRNVAISNGNECAVDHGFDPRDKFFNLHDTHNPGFWGDLLHLLATPLAGRLISDSELIFLGLLPGSSKYFFDFDLHANPDVNQSERRVYQGKLRYEKKLLWLIKISHTITERSKSAPNGYLPFDTYSGGFYNFVDNISFDFQQYLPSGTIVNPQYGFIPVVSALDIKRNNGNVNPTDYLKNYAGGTTPETALTSGFNNFIVDFMKNTPVNNAHISFQPRNGDWLAKELEEEANLIEDCSAFCVDAEIIGEHILCTTGIYSVTDMASTVNWTVIDPDNLVSFTTNDNQIILNQLNPNNYGIVTLEVYYYNPRCGSVTVTRDIEVGILPDRVSNASLTGETSVCDGQFYTYTINGANHPCITSINWTVSPNLTIVSQNATSVTVTTTLFNDLYAGVITANIANSDIVIEKGVWVGTPTSDGLVIQKIGRYDLYAERWSKLRAVYSPLIYQAHIYEPLDVTFEWQIPYSMVRNYNDTAYKDVKPRFGGQLNIGVRAVCECGNGEWKYRLFDVGGGNGVNELIPPRKSK